MRKFLAILSSASVVLVLGQPVGAAARAVDPKVSLTLLEAMKVMQKQFSISSICRGKGSRLR